MAKNKDVGARDKTCPRCRQTKLATRENFHADKRAPDGLRTDCKACRAKAVNPAAREYQRRNRERTADYQAIYYQRVTLPKRQAKQTSKPRVKK